MIPNGRRAVTAPETHLDKTYHVQINSIADEILLETLRNGIRASDGEFLRVENSSHASPGRAQFLARNYFR